MKINSSKLQQIESFTAFFEFLTKPGEYKQLLKDIHKEGTEYVNYVEKIRKIKDIDVWEASLRVDLQGEYAKLDKAKEAFQAEKQLHIDDLNKSLEAVSHSKTEITKEKEDLKTRLKGVFKLEDEKKKFNLKNIFLDKRETEIKEREFDLKEKIKKVDELLKT